MYLVYITTANKNEAEVIASKLVTDNLVACANIINNVTSIYKWQGKLNKEQEVVIIAKTIKKNVDNIVKTVKSMHNYDCPCIISLRVSDGNKDFVGWVENICK